MNTDAPWPGLDEAEFRVLGIQAKLHQWATDRPDRRFDDLFNLPGDGPRARPVGLIALVSLLLDTSAWVAARKRHLRPS